MRTIAKDLQYALRMLAKSPGFTLVALLSLGLGIGANTAVFCVLNQVLIKPLPYQDPDRVVSVMREVPKMFAPSGLANIWSYPKFEMLAKQSTVFEEVAAVAQQAYGVTRTGFEPERLEVEFVSSSYFPLLGIKTAEGRVFTEEEDSKPNTFPVALVSQELARRQFGAGAAPLGQAIRIDKEVFTVVGVLPLGFRGQTGVIDVWVPMMMAPALMFPGRLSNPNGHWHEVIARVRPALSLEAANAELAVTGRKLADQFHTNPEEGSALKALPLHQANLDPAIHRSMLIAMAAVAFVLLIACVNLANVFLARGASRQKEITTRMALGATRGRVARLLFTEALTVALLGGVLGLLVARWSTEFLAWIQPASDPALRAKDLMTLNFSAAGFDSTVLVFNLVISIVSGLFFGLLPSLRISAARISESLKETGANTIGGPRHSGTRRVLAIAQVSLSVVLLVSAGLMVRSLIELQNVPTGFEPQNVVTLRTQLPNGYDHARFNQELLTRSAALPGVQAVAVAGSTPLSSNSGGTLVRVAGLEQAPFDTLPFTTTHSVSPDYFKVLGIPLLRGRGFDSGDREGTSQVVVVSRKAAEQLWPGQDPIGKRIWLAIGWEEKDWAEVVGVVENVKYGKIEEDVVPAVYMASPQQLGEPTSFLLLRSNLAPPVVIESARQIVRAIDRGLPVYDARTMEDRSADASSRTRFIALLLACFALLSVALSATGIYGVVAYVTAARIKEFGIRLALGARRAEIALMILRDGLRLVGLGLAIGLVLSFAAARVLSAQLFGVAQTDGVTLAAVCLVLGIAGLAACYFPARSASRSDPASLLKSQ